MQLAYAAGSADVGIELSRIGLEYLGSTHLDQRRWQRWPAGNIERQPVVGGIDSGVVQRNRPGRTVSAHDRIGALQLTTGAQPEGEVDQRRKQHHRRRRSGGDLGLQQHVDGQMATRGIRGDHHVLRG
ncbi:Uncharacterised protein [Mycobacterium tuberculosis]|nr:Uncharacterised protein [Mycobacterium tuberculosis]